MSLVKIEKLMPVSLIPEMEAIRRKLMSVKGLRDKASQSTRTSSIKSLHEIYKRGYSLESLADNLGFSSTCILKWFKQNNLPRNGSLDWMKEAVPKRIYALRKERFFEKIDNPLVAYWLGFFWADGCLIKGDNGFEGVRLEVQIADKEILEKFKEDIGWGGNVENYMPTRGNLHARMNVYSKEMAANLNNLGYFPFRSKNNTPIPDVPQNLRRDFFRGLIDGDGGIYRDKRAKFPLSGFGISLAGNKEVIKSYKEFLLDTFQKDIGSNTTNGRNKNNRICFISGVNFFHVLQALYAPKDRCLESHRKTILFLINKYITWTRLGLREKGGYRRIFINKKCIPSDEVVSFSREIIEIEPRAETFWGFKNDRLHSSGRLD